MLGREAAVALTAALLPVVAWCLTCVVRHGRGGTHDPVPADVEAWHALMGVVMLALLWSTASADWAWAGAMLFVAATTWCVMRALGNPAPGRYRRLGVMSLAMVAMLVPAGSATAATGHPASHSMPHAMSMSGPASAWLSGPSALAIAAVLAVVAVPAVRSLAGTAPTRARVYAGCELVMAATMVVTALAMV